MSIQVNNYIIIKQSICNKTFGFCTNFSKTINKYDSALNGILKKVLNLKKACLDYIFGRKEDFGDRIENIQ